MDWMDLLTNFGFPVVACVYMAYNNEQNHKEREKTIGVLQQISDRLEKIENKNKEEE